MATGRSGSVTRRGSRPHPRRDVSFFGSDGVGVDRGGGELRVAQPSLQQIERDAGLDRRDPKPVAQALRRGLRPFDAGGLHHGEHLFPSGGAAKVPERGRALLFLGRRFFLLVLEPVDHRQHLEHRRRHRHGAIHAALSFLQGFKHDGAGGEVDTLADELQGLGDPTAGVGEDVAKRPDQAILVVGCREKLLLLGVSQV